MSTSESTDSGAMTPAQFAAGFRQSSRVLWCIAAGVSGDRSQAEDVLQEAALTALSKLDTFRPGSNFVAWVGQFVRYVALNQRRKSERRDRALQVQGDRLNASAAPTSASGFDAEVQRALDTLGETARTCLLLKTIVELEYTEIATLLEIPAGTAMSHVSRSRAKLQQLLAAPEWALDAGGAT